MTTTLITGANKGLGKETARQLVASGHTVYVGARDEARGREAADELGARFVQLDVTDDGSVAAAFAQVEADGGLDVLINNAGITCDRSFVKMSKADWDSVLRTDLDALFNVTKPFLPGMIERGFGRIINIGSVNGSRGAFGQTNYAAAKAGMHGFTKALALEVAKKGVTVNTVSPGYLATQMVEAVP